MPDQPEIKSNKKMTGGWYVSLFIIAMVSGGYQTGINANEETSNKPDVVMSLTTAGWIFFTVFGMGVAFLFSFFAFKIIRKYFQGWSEIIANLTMTAVIAIYSGFIAIFWFFYLFFTMPGDLYHFLWNELPRS